MGAFVPLLSGLSHHPCILTILANRGPITGIGAYVSVDTVRGEIVLSVRGTNNLRNFLTDAVFPTSSCSLVSGCEVHDGFAESWNELSSWAGATVSASLSSYPGYSLTVTGHSLGAAVATLGGAYLRAAGQQLALYNYGCPRVGNAAFADFATSQAGGVNRVTHLDDPVPRLPPLLFEYRHTSPEYWLDDGTASTDSYGVNDIEICLGDANTNCNAGTTVGLDITAHLNYFEPISGCAPSSFQFKRDSGESDAEISQRLEQWAIQDQVYAASLS